MIWLTWRQHRSEGLITLGVLAVIGVFLVVTGLELASSFQQLGQSHCLGLNSKGGPCAVLSQEFFNQYRFVQGGALVLLALQLVLGALVGAPLLAREVEQRTHLLVWTQSMTRTRWLTLKLALVLGAGLLASGALLAVLSWWHSPSAQLNGSFGNSVYDTSGPVWVATTGLSLALGVFAGALTRRTVAAIFLTIALFVAIRVPVEVLWRPHFEPPVTVTYAVDQPNPPTLGNQDWIISQGFVDAQGNRSTTFTGSCTEEETVTQCLQANGVQAQYVAYQPADRVWTFQWIETGIYLGFSLLALCAAFWLIRRRLN